MCGENIVERVKQLRWTKSKKLKMKEIGKEKKNIYENSRTKDAMLSQQNIRCDRITRDLFLFYICTHTYNCSASRPRCLSHSLANKLIGKR